MILLIDDHLSTLLDHLMDIYHSVKQQKLKELPSFGSKK